jgi:hypothetical protein
MNFFMMMKTSKIWRPKNGPSTFTLTSHDQDMFVKTEIEQEGLYYQDHHNFMSLLTCVFGVQILRLEVAIVVINES